MLCDVIMFDLTPKTSCAFFNDQTTRVITQNLEIDSSTMHPLHINLGQWNGTISIVRPF